MASKIDIKTGSESENCYKFARIMIDIGAEVSREYVNEVIKSSGYTDTLGTVNIGKFFGDHLSEIQKQKGNKYFDPINQAISPSIVSLDKFDIGACAAIIQNMFDTRYKKLPFNHTIIIFHNTKYDKLYELRKIRNEVAHLFVFRLEGNHFTRIVQKIEEIFPHLCGPSYSNYKIKIQAIMDDIVNDKAVQDYKTEILKILIDERDQLLNFLNEFSNKINEQGQTTKTILNEIFSKLSNGENLVLTEISKLSLLMNDDKLFYLISDESKKTQELVNKYETFKYNILIKINF